MWVIIGEIVLGLVRLALSYITQKKDPDVYEKARELQQRTYEINAEVLASGEELTRAALLRHRLVAELLRSRKLRTTAGHPK